MAARMMYGCKVFEAVCLSLTPNIAISTGIIPNNTLQNGPSVGTAKSKTPIKTNEIKNV